MKTARPRHEAPKLDTPEPPKMNPVLLTQALFGVTYLGNEKWLAVEMDRGVVRSLSPKRGGADAGEAKHFAVARAAEAFKVSVLGRRA